MKKTIFLPVTAIAIFLLTACGNNTTKPETNGPATETTPPVPTSSAAAGMDIYNKTCVACHQASGMGIPNSFPPLAKSDFLNDKEKTINQVLKGYSGELTVNGQKYNQTMPAQQLNDDEIAAVLTYVYSSFGNNGSTVTPAEVKAQRDKK